MPPTKRKESDTKIKDSDTKRKESDRNRKVTGRVKARMDKHKSFFLQSFNDTDNLFDTKNRQLEMASLPTGLLGGNEFDEAEATNLYFFTTFPAKVEHFLEQTSVTGCVPLSLMQMLLNELKPDVRFGRIIELGQAIGRPQGQTAKRNEAGVYFMVHWKRPPPNMKSRSKKKSITWIETLEGDWKEQNDVHSIFSTIAVQLIEEFGRCILLSLGFKDTKSHSLFPGVVYTENSFSQAAHLDFDESILPASQKSWILHMPLQREGMLLSVWDLPVVKGARDEAAKHHYLHIPFGSYVALRSDVLHSGVYGSSGNSRFHMILQFVGGEKQSITDEVTDELESITDELDSLHYYDLPEDEQRAPWRPVFVHEIDRFKFFTDTYIQQLRDKTSKGGGVNPGSHDYYGLLNNKQWAGAKRKYKKKKTK
jgi:hypothetical protein